MILVDLQPYPAKMIFFKKEPELFRYYLKKTKQLHPYAKDRDPRCEGHTLGITKGGKVEHLVWATNPEVAAHEFCHVAFKVFKDIGEDPSLGHSEPFCYLVSHMMESVGYNK